MWCRYLANLSDVGLNGKFSRYCSPGLGHRAKPFAVFQRATPHEIEDRVLRAIAYTG